MASIASLASREIRNVRRKSPPDPSGTMASLLVVGIGAPLWKKPLTTSLRVPSPPTATTTGRDSLTSRSVISVASSGRVVKTLSYSSPLEGSQLSSAAHSLPARPPPDAGLTMNRTGAPARPPMLHLPARGESSRLQGRDLLSLLPRPVHKSQSRRPPTWREPDPRRGDG